MRTRKALAWSLAAVIVVGGLGAAVAREKAEQTFKTKQRAARITGGNPDRGLAAIGRFGCGGCHIIPGAPGASGQAGPPLTGVAARSYIAGRFANDPKTMVQWIRFPQAMEPGVAMPQMGVGEQQGRDIAAYLYTLK